MDRAPQSEKRREGRTRALEGLLASQFGGRPTQAGDKAIERLRAMSRVSTEAVPPLPPPQVSKSKIIAIPYGSWMALAAAVAIMAGGLAYWGYALWGTPAMAILESAPPGLIISREGVHLTPQIGMRIEEGDALLADAQSETDATLRLRRQDVTVHIRPGASLQLSETSGFPSIQVLRGRLEVDASGLRPGQYLELGTLQAQARTTGGRFSLAAKLTSTWLEVFEGSVELRRSSDPDAIRVEAQCYAVAALGLVLTPHPLNERWQTPYSVARPGPRQSDPPK